MPETNPARRMTLLVVAGDLGASWAPMLEGEGFYVRSPGWLDAVTTARVERPDAVLVSADLPANAPFILTRALRGSSDLASIPLVVAGISEDDADAHGEGLLRADRYFPSPVDPASVARELHERIRLGSVRRRRTPAQNAVLAVLLLGALAMASRAIWEGLSGVAPSIGRLSRAVDMAFLAWGVATVAVGIAALAATRVLTLRDRRSMVGWTAVALPHVGNGLEGSYPFLFPVGISAACLAGIVWARLGLGLQPRPSTGWRRWYQFLMVFLAALAAALWAAWAILRGG